MNWTTESKKRSKQTSKTKTVQRSIINLVLCSLHMVIYMKRYIYIFTDLDTTTDIGKLTYVSLLNTKTKTKKKMMWKPNYRSFVSRSSFHHHSKKKNIFYISHSLLNSLYMVNVQICIHCIHKWTDFLLTPLCRVYTMIIII